MSYCKDSSMKYTLNDRLEDLSVEHQEVKELFTLWKVIEKDLSDKLSETNRIFPHFSRHDVNHSKSLITNISLFLGENKIRELSPTDTFLIIFCSYVHDYGMSYDLEEVYTILDDRDNKFKEYLDNNKHKSEAKILYKYYNESIIDKTNIQTTLKELYRSIIVILEEYLRPKHFKGVEKITKDFNILLRGRIKSRFIKAIVTICKLHGENFNEIFKKLDFHCTGIFADDCHPRFIAAMIRIGDLLDLDNGRFSKEFERAFYKENNNIPEISKIHFLKHEAITHLSINSEFIEIKAKCEGENARIVANEISNWLNQLETECYHLNANWWQIAQNNLGTPPIIKEKAIYINGTPFLRQFHDLKMELPNDRIFSLLTGSNIYKDKYIAFREVIQNAIDATLLQVWSDFSFGKYDNFNKKLPQDNMLSYFIGTKTSFKGKQYIDSSRNTFLNHYKIQVNVITDYETESIYIEVIDNGIGIADEDLVYMAKIGGNHMSNPGINNLVKEMPGWFSPSSAFGIGLQSLFQLTNQIDFYTKKENRTPRRIVFYSYSKNKGSIDITKCPEGKDYKKYFDKISSHGTMVRFKIEEKLFLEDNTFFEYDKEFDGKESLYKYIKIEIIRMLKKYLYSVRYNYFPIYFESIANYSEENQSANCSEEKQIVFPNITAYQVLLDKKHMKYSNYNANHERGINLYYFDVKNKLYFDFTIPNVTIINNESNKSDNINEYYVEINLLSNFFKLHYKYSYIDNYENLFQRRKINDTPYFEMIKDNKNIMCLDVGIFDKNASKYLSIDRNTLKFSGLSYDDIKLGEIKSFTLLCEELVESKHINKNSFAILALLFTRFVDHNLVKAFMENYTNNIKYFIKIGGKKISLECLCNETSCITIYTTEKNFFTNNKFHNIIASDVLIKENIDNNTEDALFFITEIYKYFPKNFFCPTKIERVINDDNQIKIKYSCKIRRETEDKILVKMDKASKISDLIYCLHNNEPYKKMQIFSLIRCLFKPWSDYSAIVVSKHPDSFSNKHNFNNILEQNIFNCILSPFEKSSVYEIHGNLNMEKNDFINLISNTVEESQQLKKCVNYVKIYGIKNRISEEVIKNNYLKFVREISGYIWDIYNNTSKNK